MHLSRYGEGAEHVTGERGCESALVWGEERVGNKSRLRGYSSKQPLT